MSRTCRIERLVVGTLALPVGPNDFNGFVALRPALRVPVQLSRWTRLGVHALRQLGRARAGVEGALQYARRCVGGARRTLARIGNCSERAAAGELLETGRDVE